MKPPSIARWIAFAGWAGVFVYTLLAAGAFMSPPPGISGFLSALAHFPYIVGSLLTIGAAEALNYLADIGHEARIARRERVDAESRARENPDRWRAG